MGHCHNKHIYFSIVEQKISNNGQRSCTVNSFCFLYRSPKLIILYGNEARSEARLVTSPFIARGINLVYLL